MDVQSLESLKSDRREALFDRSVGIESIRASVVDVVERVRVAGNDALYAYTEEFDDIEIDRIDITEDIEGASNAIDPALKSSLETAAANIRRFHERQLPEDWTVDDAEGVTVGRRFRPIERVGVYVPGGRASYPSSAFMGVIPAQVAGVDEIVVATPPGDPVNPVTLAALDIAGVDQVIQIGGAQAIAALAHGTASVPAVQKIVGPGNRWVTAAKSIVRDSVAIDFLAGPSEILVIADETAVPAYVASDLLAQAEHDPDASVVALCTDEEVADAIAKAVESQLESQARKETIISCLENATSGIFTVASLEAACSFAEAYAAEHLSIQVAEDLEQSVLDAIDSAGSIFLGPYTPVAAGDYASGTNHVLPTGRQAKLTGGLSVDTFMRASTIQRLDETGLTGLADTITDLARAEGLDAHARSVSLRLEGRQD